MEASLTLLSTDVKSSTEQSHLLLRITNPFPLTNPDISEREFYSDKIVDTFTNGVNNTTKYDEINIENNPSQALHLGNHIIFGYKNSIRTYCDQTMEHFKTIDVECKYLCVDKSQLYVHNYDGQTNIYDANIEFICTLGTECKFIFAFLYQDDIYCIWNRYNENIHFENQNGDCLNDGQTINKFKYKNTCEIKSLLGLTKSFFQMDNGKTKTCAIVNQENIYVIDPTFSTIISHEELPFENNIYNVVYLDNNCFDVYWRREGETYGTHAHVSRYQLNVINESITNTHTHVELTTELTTELVNTIDTNSHLQIHCLIENIPDTTITKRICYNSTIVDHLSNGFRIKRYTLTINNRGILIPENYTVHVLGDKMMFGFENNAVHVFDIKTLKFIRTFANITYFNTDSVSFYLHMENRKIECCDKSLSLVGIIKNAKCYASIAEEKFHYILIPENNGFLINDIEASSVKTITTLKYGNEIITLGQLHSLFQLTDDKNNVYCLVADDYTIYVIEPTTERVLYRENFYVRLKQVTHANDNCFNVYPIRNDSNLNDCTRVLQYKLKMINSCVEFVEL